MRKAVKKQTVCRAVASVVMTLATASFGLAAASPTTVFNAAAAIGYDGSNFSSLSVGLNSSNNPDSLVNLDSSVITGQIYNSANGYGEDYYLNLHTLAVSIVGFNDSNHQIVGSNGYTYNTSLSVTSPSGTLLGSQARNANDGSGETTPTGEDVFVSSNGNAPVLLPLPTTVLGGHASYSYTNTQTGTTDYSLFVSAASTNPLQTYSEAISPTGVITGTVSRYAGDGSSGAAGQSLSQDSFYYDPSTGTTTAIGFTGGQYSYSPYSSDPTLVLNDNSSGGMAGNSTATGMAELFDPQHGRAGNDAWVYTPSLGTVQIGFIGGQYTYTTNGTKYEWSQVNRTNSAGQIAGISLLVGGAGDPLFDPQQAWLYTPSATPGTASGYGTSSAGSYVVLGLVTPTTSSNVGNLKPDGTRYTNITFLANNGNAAGTSTRYDSSGTTQGSAAWYFNGITNIDISPTDAIHGYASGGVLASNNTVTALNNTGMAAAFATRISGTASGSATRGQDAYVWDSTTNTGYFVDPTDAAMGSSNYEYSYIGTLTDNGIAVGYYNTYNGTSPAVQSSNLFVWTKINGLQLLATYAGSAASSSMANYVSSFQLGADGELYGPNTYGSNPTSVVAYGFNDIWNNSYGSGNGTIWNASSQNWTNGVIPLVYLDSASVTFNDNNNHNYAVTLNSSVKPNAVTFNNSSGNYVISGSGSITGGGLLTKSGSATATLNTVNTYTGGTTVNAGVLVIGVKGALPVGSLSITGGKLQLNSNTGVATVTSLSFSGTTGNWTGQLDLVNNQLIVQNGSIGQITSQLSEGFGNGTWQGSGGIVSSTAASNTTHLTAVGAIQNNQSGTALYSAGNSFEGAVPGASDILLKYTYYGDTNLDGKVDGSDYSRIDAAYLSHRTLTGWFNGDFNYDGAINGSDYTLIDNAFNTQGAQLTDQMADPAATPTSMSSETTAVPEPGTLAGIGLAVAAVFGRRRAKNFSGASCPKILRNYDR